MIESELHCFWFEFDLPDEVPAPRGIRNGIGVTATTPEEALAVIARAVFGDGPLPAVRQVVVDVVFHALCPWNVLPNMHEPWGRGIWFPVGYR